MTHGIVWAEFVALLTVVLTLVFGRRGTLARPLARGSLACRTDPLRRFLAAIGGGNDLRRAAGPEPGGSWPAGRGQRPGWRVAAAIRHSA